MRPLHLLIAAALTLAAAGPALAQQPPEPNPRPTPAPTPPMTEKQRGETFSRAFSAGLQLLTARRLEAAERAFKACVQLYPDRPVAHYNLACTYSVWGRPTQAVEALHEAFRLGYRDLLHMERDMDLDPIRKSPVFRRAMTEFAADVSRSNADKIYRRMRSHQVFGHANRDSSFAFVHADKHRDPGLHLCFGFIDQRAQVFADNDVSHPGV